MALTRITKGVIKPNENYDTHNINSTGIVTAIGLDVNGNGDISGNLSVGGVLTYEDVTSIDSVGVITARDGIDCNGDLDVDGHTNLDNISIAGVTTVANDTYFTLGSNATANNNLRIRANSSYNRNEYRSTYQDFFATDLRIRHISTNNHLAYFWSSEVAFFQNGTKRLSTAAAGANVYGNLQISSNSPRLLFIDENANNDFSIKCDGGSLQFVDSTDSYTTRMSINSSGNVSIAKNLDVDGHTNLDNVSVAGVSTFSGIVAAGIGSTAITLGNNHKITLGSAHELELHHDGSNSYIKQRFFAYPSRLKIISENSGIDIMSGSGGSAHGGYENAISCENNGATKIYHAGVGPYFETYGAGVMFQGSIQVGYDIFHHGDTDTRIRFPTLDTISFDTAGGERLRIDNTGHTTIKSGAHDKGLDILPTANSRETRLRIQGKASDGTEHTFTFAAKASSNSLNMSGTGPMCFIGSQNVGVQNAAPDSPLQIGGGTNPHSTKATVHIAPVSGNAMLTLRGGAPTLYFDRTSGGLPTVLTDGADLIIKNGTLDTGGDERLRIKSNGNVSIGNNPTVHADTIFHVEKSSGETNVIFEGNDTMGARLSLQNNDTSSTANNQINFKDAGGQATSAIIGYNTDQTNNHGELVLATRSAQGTPPEERLRITSQGRVNIGEANLTQTTTSLNVTRSAGGTVAGESVIAATLGNDSTMNGAILTVRNAGNRGNKGNSNGSKLVSFEFNDANAFMIDKNGYVGIRTENPSALLNINTFASGSNDAIVISRDSYGMSGKLVNASGSLQVISNKQLVLKSDPSNQFTAAGSYIGFEVDGAEKVRIDNGGRIGINAVPSVSHEYLHIKPVGNNVLDLRYELNNSNDIRHKYYDSDGVWRGGFNFSQYANNSDYPNFHDSYYWMTNPGTDNSGLRAVMRLNNRGILVQPYLPAFHWRKDAGQTYTTSWTTIGYADKIFDRGTAIQGSDMVSGSTFTAPVTGIYYFHADANIVGFSNNYQLYMGFFLNGNQYSRSMFSYNQERKNHHIDMIIEMQQGDTVDARAKISNGTVNGDNDGKFFGYLIG